MSSSTIAVLKFDWNFAFINLGGDFVISIVSVRNGY